MIVTAQLLWFSVTKGGISLSDVTITTTNASSIDIGKTLDAVTGVILTVGQDDSGNDVVYEVGDSTGYVVQAENPMGTLEMANMILSALKLRGFAYQAFESNCYIDPASEIGDSVTVAGVSSNIYSIESTHSRLMSSDVSAPFDEEVNHEYQFESKTDRVFKREIGSVKATLSIQSDEISAKVSATGGDNSSFGWSLLSNEFGLYSNNSKVFYVNSDGAHVNGEITATSGTIGGFTIGSSAIYNGIESFGSGTSYGVYLGTNGIQLGQNFKVTTSGNVTANNMTVTGTLTVGGSQITAANLYTGASQSASNYSSWNTSRDWTSNNGSYCVTGSGYGYDYDDSTGSYASGPSYFTCGSIGVRGSGNYYYFSSGVYVTISGTTYCLLGYVAD